MQRAYAWSTCKVDVLPGTENGDEEGTLTSPWLHVQPDAPGVWVWTVTNHRACPWPLEDYGQFYQNSVYLVLTTVGIVELVPFAVCLVTQAKSSTPASILRNLKEISQKEQHFDRNLHILVGKYASESDYRAVFSVLPGLRRALGDDVRLHRQVQGRETNQFRHIFNPVVYWLGGPERSYRQCTLRKTSYKARLVQLFKPDVHGSNVVGKEVPCNVKELDPAFTYILDTGPAMYMWQGDLTSTKDDMRSIRFLENLRAARGGGVKVEVLNEEQLEGHTFYNYLSHDGYRREDDYMDEDQDSTLHRNSLLGGNGTMKRRTLAQLVQVYFDPKTANRKKRKSTPSTILSAEFRAIKQGEISGRDFVDGDLYVYDSGERVWLWISQKALDTERQLALHLGHMYLKATNHPLLPLTVVQEENPDAEFTARLNSSSQNGRGSRHQNGVHFQDDFWE